MITRATARDVLKTIRACVCIELSKAEYRNRGLAWYAALLVLLGAGLRGSEAEPIIHDSLTKKPAIRHEPSDHARLSSGDAVGARSPIVPAVASVEVALKVVGLIIKHLGEHDSGESPGIRDVSLSVNSANMFVGDRRTANINFEFIADPRTISDYDLTGTVFIEQPNGETTTSRRWIHVPFKRKSGSYNLRVNLQGVDVGEAHLRAELELTWERGIGANTSPRGGSCADRCTWYPVCRGEPQVCYDTCDCASEAASDTEPSAEVTFSVQPPISFSWSDDRMLVRHSIALGLKHTLFLYNASTEPFVLNHVESSDNYWDSDCAGSVVQGVPTPFGVTVTHDEPYECDAGHQGGATWLEYTSFSGFINVAGGKWRYGETMCLEHDCCGTDGTCDGMFDLSTECVDEGGDVLTSITIGPIVDPTLPVALPHNFVMHSPLPMIPRGAGGYTAAPIDFDLVETIAGTAGQTPVPDFAVEFAPPPSSYERISREAPLYLR